MSTSELKVKRKRTVLTQSEKHQEFEMISSGVPYDYVAREFDGSLRFLRKLRKEGNILPKLKEMTKQHQMRKVISSGYFPYIESEVFNFVVVC